MIRRLGVRVALFGLLAMTAAGVPVEIGILERAQTRAHQDEMNAISELTALAARTLSSSLGTPQAVATLTELCAATH
ncbi:MAG: hypothetical protein IPI49_33275, partial [Myxococcales bacterium]|nr:hypothetical protein [Myxococcales bacterium]